MHEGLMLLSAAALGAAGSLMRHAVSRLYARLGWLPERATLTVNVSGAALLGLLIGGTAGLAQGTTYMLLGSSLLGGFTTFSTLMLQLANLMEQRAHRRLWTYALQTFLLGIPLAGAGYLAGSWLAVI